MPATVGILNASAIRSRLDDLVIGQIEAKERLSFLLSMHQTWDPRLYPLNPPPNGLILGPTGCGKTFSVQVASEALGVPFLAVDSTTLVPSGARNGNSIDLVTEEVGDLIISNDERLKELGIKPEIIAKRNPKAIIFFDEFDKLTSRKDDTNKQWKLDVQRILLKFVESNISTAVTAANRGILSLAGGAFVGIESNDIVRQRRPEVAALMRTAPKGAVVAEDVVNYGFMPELVARFPAIIQYEALPEDALLKILQHQKTSPLIVWQNHFTQLGKELSFSDGFMAAVAKRATALQMGARALQQVVFQALARRAYAFEESPDVKVEVTEAVLDMKET